MAKHMYHYDITVSQDFLSMEALVILDAPNFTTNFFMSRTVAVHIDVT